MQNQNLSPSDSYQQTTTAQPSRPGAYWFQGETMSRKVLVNVRRKNGELTVRLFNQDVLVADLKGHWRGPIPPFYEPLSEKPIRF